MIQKENKQFLKDTTASIDEGTDVCCLLIVILLIGIMVLAFFVWAFSVHILVGLTLLIIIIYLIDHFLNLGIFKSIISSFYETKEDIDWKNNYANLIQILEIDLRNLADNGAEVSRIRHDLNEYISKHNRKGILNIENEINEKKSNQQKIKTIWQGFQDIQKQISLSELHSNIKSDLEEIEKTYIKSKKTLESADVQLLIKKIDETKNKFNKLQDIKNEGFKF
jgi:hypothetical protein